MPVLMPAANEDVIFESVRLPRKSGKALQRSGGYFRKAHEYRRIILGL
jgi:hypothetical protein